MLRIGEIKGGEVEGGDRWELRDFHSFFPVNFKVLKKMLNK